MYIVHWTCFSVLLRWCLCGLNCERAVCSCCCRRNHRLTLARRWDGVHSWSANQFLTVPRSWSCTVSLLTSGQDERRGADSSANIGARVQSHPEEEEVGGREGCRLGVDRHRSCLHPCCHCRRARPCPDYTLHQPPRSLISGAINTGKCTIHGLRLWDFQDSQDSETPKTLRLPRLWDSQNSETPNTPRLPRLQGSGTLFVYLGSIFVFTLLSLYCYCIKVFISKNNQIWQKVLKIQIRCFRLAVRRRSGGRALDPGVRARHTCLLWLYLRHPSDQQG